jgi:hypothetical protein
MPDLSEPTFCCIQAHLAMFGQLLERVKFSNNVLRHKKVNRETTCLPFRRSVGLVNRGSPISPEYPR